MRGKLTILNSLVSILATLVSILCGLILPRLILTRFGSAYNGLTSSISQFLSWVALLQAGVVSVTKAALYEPIKDNDKLRINQVINATKLYMNKVGILYLIILIFLACIYPVVVLDEFPFGFSCSMVLITGSSSFANYYFGTAYKTIISADQRQYILNIVQIITTIGNTIAAAWLIYVGAEVRIVYFGIAIVSSLNPIILNIYAKRKYKLDSSIAAKPEFLSQRKDSFVIQLANVLHDNTDIVLITLFAGSIKEVSVYTVYYYIVHALSNLTSSFLNSIEAAFGNMLTRKEDKLIQINFTYIEIILYSVNTLFFAVALSSILDFVRIYTYGITDVDYFRPTFSLLMVLASYVYSIRTPYQSIATAAGRFKEMRNGAIIEVIINMVLSMILVHKFGLCGVVFATLVSSLFRSVQYIYYVVKNIIKRDFKQTFINIFISIVGFAIIYFSSKLLHFNNISNYIQWIEFTVGVFIYGIFIIVGLQICFNRKVFMSLCRKIYRILKK
jgi:O-antigen/teichoic acid export membrane protein